MISILTLASTVAARSAYMTVTQHTVRRFEAIGYRRTLEAPGYRLTHFRPRRSRQVRSTRLRHLARVIGRNLAAAVADVPGLPALTAEDLEIARCLALASGAVPSSVPRCMVYRGSEDAPHTIAADALTRADRSGSIMVATSPQRTELLGHLPARVRQRRELEAYLVEEIAVVEDNPPEDQRRA